MCRLRPLLRLVFARKFHRLLQIQKRSRRLAPGEQRGGLTPAGRGEVLVQESPRERGCRDHRSCRRTFHHRLPQASRVLRPAGDRQVHARRELRPQRAADELDGDADRRPALQSVREAACDCRREGLRQSEGGQIYVATTVKPLLTKSAGFAFPARPGRIFREVGDVELHKSVPTASSQ